MSIMENIEQITTEPLLIPGAQDALPRDAIEDGIAEYKQVEPPTDEHELPTEEISESMVERISDVLRDNVRRRQVGRRVGQTARRLTEQQPGQLKHIGRITSVIGKQKERLTEKKPKK